MRAAVSDLDGKEYQRAFLHARMEVSAAEQHSHTGMLGHCCHDEC